MKPNILYTLMKNKSVLSLSEFIMKCKTKIMFPDMKAWMLSFVSRHESMDVIFCFGVNYSLNCQ